MAEKLGLVGELERLETNFADGNDEYSDGCSRAYSSAVSHVLDAIAEIAALPDPLNRDDVFRILREEEE